MPRRWVIPSYDADKAREIVKEVNIPFPLGAALVARGFDTPDKVDRFLKPRLSDLGDPFTLPGMEKAVTRIWDAVEAQESILIFGDYDVDGVSSTALMVSFLSELGAMVTPFLPNRLTDGYGFSRSVLTRCLDQHRPELIVTVDCGTGSGDTVAYAAEQGIDVIVTDHHEASAELAHAIAIVNPKLGDDDSVRMLAGVGVAFKVCHAMVKRAREQGRPGAEDIDLRPFMDFVALGTIADIVPLIEENRILARHGLKWLKTPRALGLRTLMDVAGIKDDVQAHHVGFQLGPRLNAAGRMGDADAALELLLTEDGPRAHTLAMRLDAANRERQDIENRMVREARAELDAIFDPDKHFGLVISRNGWHPGVIGIVASRLCQHFYRPVVVIGMDEETGRGRGSCRSIDGFDLVANLDRCSEHLLQFGGHNMAAGVEVAADKLDAFRVAFNEAAAEVLAQKELKPLQKIDAWLELAEADDWLFRSQQSIRPFGHSNPTPVWAARQVRVVRHRIVGNGHLQMTLAGGGVTAEAIGFGLGDREVPAGPIDVAFQLKKNTYQGRESLRLDIQDFRAAEAE